MDKKVEELVECDGCTWLPALDVRKIARQITIPLAEELKEVNND